MPLSIDRTGTTDTSASLLDRLIGQGEGADWHHLVELHDPLIRNWLCRQGVGQSDCDDLFQEIMLVVMRRLPTFRHNRNRGAFRNWLRMITVNCLRQAWRQDRLRPRAAGGSDCLDLLGQLEDPESGLSRQ